MTMSPSAVVLLVLAASAVSVDATFFRRPRSFSKVISNYRPYPSGRRTYATAVSSAHYPHHHGGGHHMHHKVTPIIIEVCRKEPAGDPLGVCFKQATKAGGAYLLQCPLGTRFNMRTCDCDLSFSDPREHYQGGYDCAHGAVASVQSGAAVSSTARAQSVAATARAEAVAIAQARAVAQAEARAEAAVQALAKARAQVQAQAQATASAIAEIQAQTAAAHRQAEQAIAQVKAQAPTAVSASGGLEQMTTKAASAPATSSSSSSAAAAAASASASASTSAGVGLPDDMDLLGSAAGKVRSSADMARLLGGAPEDASSSSAAASAASASASSGAETSFLKELNLAASTAADSQAMAETTAELTRFLLASTAGVPNSATSGSSSSSSSSASSSSSSTSSDSAGSLLKELGFKKSPY